MTTLAWIVVACLGMSLVSLSGTFTLVLPDRMFDRVVLPLVAVAAGSLLGGALFHLLPESTDRQADVLPVYVLLAVGVFTFFLLEQFLKWHHRRGSSNGHQPLGHLILVAGGLHSLIDGLAIGTAFVVDPRLGLVTWLVTAAHEVPQEMGDFGILVHSGWGRRSALTYNLLASLTVLVGGLLAYWLSASVDVALLLPFAAGNFIYVSLADLVPEIAASSAPREQAVGALGFGLGLVLLLGVAAVG